METKSFFCLQNSWHIVATHEMSVKLNSENRIIIIASSFSQNVLLDKVDTLSAETLKKKIYVYIYI